MTYAYVIVKYVTYIQIQIHLYITIVSLAMGCQKTCGGSFLYINGLSYFIYYKMSVSFFMTCALACNSQV